MYTLKLLYVGWLSKLEKSYWPKSLGLKQAKTAFQVHPEIFRVTICVKRTVQWILHSFNISSEHLLAAVYRHLVKSQNTQTNSSWTFSPFNLSYLFILVTLYIKYLNRTQEFTFERKEVLTYYIYFVFEYRIKKEV